MNASSEFLASGSSYSVLFGQRVCDLGWNGALGLVEGLVSLRGNRTTLGFFDERAALRQAFDIGYRDQLNHRLLLPAGGRILGMAERLSGHRAPVHFSAASFLPALLTFLEKRSRIGIAGEDIRRLDVLREHFSVHTPWHEVVTIVPGQEGAQHFDIVIVDAPGFAAEKQVERRLVSVGTGLVIMAGAGLSGFVGRLPAQVKAREAGAPATASFA